MTPNEVITEVRRLTNDVRSTVRNSDAVLLGFVNQTIKRMVVLRPDLFGSIEEIPTTAGTVLQTMPSDSMRLVEIFQVKNGNAVTEASRETLDQNCPTWQTDDADYPVNFMRHVRNPNKYFLYPKPLSGVVLIGEYVKVPADYTIDASITALPAAYFPSLVDGTVYLVSSVDNEHVNSGRAKLFQDSFIQSLGVGLQSRGVTDTEQGGLEPKQVIA